MVGMIVRAAGKISSKERCQGENVDLERETVYERDSFIPRYAVVPRGPSTVGDDVGQRTG